MERLSKIIQKIYHKYLPIAEKTGTILNLDFPDTTIIVSDGDCIEKTLDKIVKSAIARTSGGTIKITVSRNHILVQDTGTIIPKTICDKLTKDKIIVQSRVGFGNKITIKL